MADLEPIIQRLEAQTAQFDAALEESERKLRGLGPASEQASRRLAVGMQGASTSVVGSTGRMVSSARSLQVGFRSLGTQVGETVAQIAAGRAPMEALAVNAAQAASAFGPMGIAVGVAGTALVAIAAGLLSTGREAEAAAGSVEDLTDVLKELGEQDTAVQRVIAALEDLSSEARRAAALHVKVEFEDLEAKAAEAADELLRGLEGALGSRRTQLALPGLDESARAEMELQVGVMTELAESFRAGRIEAIDFVEALDRIPEGGTFSGLTAGALEAFEAFRKARTELEAAQATLDFVSRRASSGPPGLPPDALARLEPEGRDRRDRPTRATAQPATLADITGPIERENALLAEGVLTREEIASLLQAERVLKRELVGDEERLLLAAVATNRALIDRQKAAETRFVESDREAEQDLIRLRQEGVQVTEEVRTATEVYAAAVEHLRQLLAEGAISQETYNKAVARAKLEMDQAGVSAEEMSLSLAVTVETGRIFASTLASGISRAVFEAGSAAHKIAAMGQALAEAVVQAVIFQSVMAAIGSPGVGGSAGSGLFGFFGGGGSGGGGAPATGGGPIQLTPFFGGGRQHGGPVLPGVSYLVGERGPERFVPGQAGNIIPNGGGGGGGTQIVINDQRGRSAPPIEQNVDARGVISMTIRSEVNGMARDGSLNRLTGVRPRGIARG